MSPEKAKVGIFETDETMRIIYNTALTLDGHEVIFEAGSKEEMMKIDPETAQNMDVAIIRGKMSQSSTEQRDGEEVNIILKKLNPDIKTIGISEAEPVKGVDESIDTTEIGDISRIVTEL